jgi:Ca2+-binding RTX toxin-like protein
MCKKFVSVAAVAVTLAGLAGVTPASAASKVTCNGVTPTATVQAGSNNPFYIGTAGNDVIVVTGTAQAAPTEIFAGAGNDTICNQSGNRLFVFGAAGDDTYYGNNTASFFYGGNGNDAAYGGAGNETLMGGAGNDYLYGGAGNDFVSGNAGDDVVFGGAGADTVIGGLGTDVLSGHGKESKDDKVADKLYGQTSEVYPKGTGDVVNPLDQAVASLNASMKKALTTQYKDTKKYVLSSGGQVIDGETFSGANILEVMDRASSNMIALWIAS